MNLHRDFGESPETLICFWMAINSPISKKSIIAGKKIVVTDVGYFYSDEQT